MTQQLKKVAMNGGISEQQVDEELDILDKFSKEKQKEYEDFQKTQEYKDGVKAYNDFDRDNKVEITLR